MNTWVALLRGINLGARRKVSMPVLREALGEAGFADVRTYINSGNVVLYSAATDPGEVAEAVRRVVEKRFGLGDVPVMVRTPNQLAKVLAWNPFPDAAVDRPQLVGVIHLAERPDPARLREVLDADVAPDRIAARDLEVVVAYGARTTGSPAERVLKRIDVDATARNWRTLQALVDLTQHR